MLDYWNIIWVHSVHDLMNRWDSGVKFNAMLNNLWWNSLQINIIPCKNVLIFLEQCFSIYHNWSNQYCTIWGFLIVPKLNSHIWWSSSNVNCVISNSWTLICAGIISTKISTSKCGKLNLRSSILTSTPEIAALRISNFSNVRKGVLILN